MKTIGSLPKVIVRVILCLYMHQAVVRRKCEYLNPGIENGQWMGYESGFKFSGLLGELSPLGYHNN